MHKYILYILTTRGSKLTNRLNKYFFPHISGSQSKKELRKDLVKETRIFFRRKDREGRLRGLNSV